MKKLATIILVAVLTCSFMVGAFTSTQAGNPQNDKITKQCVKSKYLVCNMDDCRVYYLWFCPYGTVLEWTGDFCPATSGCW